jgi:glycosyltransferase involved in cell wall biosynthesis
MKIVYAGVMGGQNGFTKAMATVCDEFIDIPMANVNQGLMDLTSADIVFLQPQDRGISNEALNNLKNIGAWICNWSGDVRRIIPPCYFEYGQIVDLTAFSNMNDVKTLRGLGYNAEFLQIGYDPALYFADENVVKDIDIVFMGNNVGGFPLSGYRMEMVQELKRVYGDRFKACGIGQRDGNFMGDQQGEARTYRSAKIGINLSHFNYERYSSDRLFRMLGTGILVLSHEYPGIYEDFNPHDMGIWQDFDQLKSHIDYYLANEDARVKIASNGHEKAISKHTFECMARDIIKLYEQRNG